MEDGGASGHVIVDTLARQDVCKVPRVGSFLRIASIMRIECGKVCGSQGRKGGAVQVIDARFPDPFHEPRLLLNGDSYNQLRVMSMQLTVMKGNNACHYVDRWCPTHAQSCNGLRSLGEYVVLEAVVWSRLHGRSTAAWYQGMTRNH